MLIYCNEITTTAGPEDKEMTTKCQHCWPAPALGLISEPGRDDYDQKKAKLMKIVYFNSKNLITYRSSTCQ
jgi:hypothetical protein